LADVVVGVGVGVLMVGVLVVGEGVGVRVGAGVLAVVVVVGVGVLMVGVLVGEGDGVRVGAGVLAGVVDEGASGRNTFSRKRPATLPGGEYWHTKRREQLRPNAHPICDVAFQTTAVKWPVCMPKPGAS
jgi:hypothetical protein